MRVWLLRKPMRMDNYYASQMASTFQGPTRQFVSGAGIGVFALRVGRTAMPLLKKCVGLFVKQVGQNVLQAALPEVVSLIQGKEKFKRAVEDGTKKASAKTCTTAGGSLAGGVWPGGGGPSGPRKRKLNTDGTSLPPTPCRRRSAAAKDQVISHKTKSKRSLVDFLANVKFNGSRQ